MERKVPLKVLVVGIAVCGMLLRGARAADAPAAGLLPVPNPSLQARAREMIRTLYKTEYAKKGAADRVALAGMLIKQARDSADDPAAQYVLLSDAADLASGAGDAATALAAIREVASVFTVDLLDLQQMALVRAHAVATNTGDFQTIMTLALETAGRAAEVDAFDRVEKLANLAEDAANKTRQVRVVASIQVQLAELRALIAEFGRVRAAFAKLEKNPADADAHLVIGKFYALHKGQWALGLPHLAQSSEGVLRDLAMRELSRPAEGLVQVELGDAWWGYAQDATGPARVFAAAHAREWYKTAQATIQGITLARIQARIAGETGATGLNSGATGASVDLLGLIDPAKDVSAGTWLLAGKTLRCDASAYACIAIPYRMPAEYALSVAFTRVEGAGPVALFLVAGNRGFGFALDVKGEARFERVDNKVAKDNPTITPVAITNGRKYSLSVEVRKGTVRAILDGKQLVEYKTDYKDLSRYPVWKLKDATLCGIGANNARVVFDAVSVTEIAGKGKAVR